MSSFNTVTKVKYSDRTAEPVTLNEYIVFQDDKSKLKYLVFRFTNNVTQQLLGMRFEVCQYNVDNDLIEKSVVAYDRFLAGAEEEFVPKAKLRVSYYCSTISVRLIQAAFDRFVWNEGEFNDNTYKFGMFYHDEVHTDEDKESSKKPKADNVKKQKDKKERKEKQDKRVRQPFTIKDVTARNRAIFPKIFNVLVVILVLVFVSVTLVLFKKDTKKFTFGDYLVRVYDDGVAIYGYTGSKNNLVIPEKIGDYTVTKIDSGAFKNSDISTVTINYELTVSTDAFVNCKKLRNFNAKAKVTVMSGAFKGCNEALKDNFSYPENSKILPDYIVD